jgi:phage-related protein
VKPVHFLGDSLKRLRAFPRDARHDAGQQINKVQQGQQPDDFKSMPTIGRGVEELRIWDETGTYRVVFTARLPEAIYVLHAFQKKSQATSNSDIVIAQRRYAQLMSTRS